jgi:hypothetical protein
MVKQQKQTQKTTNKTDGFASEEVSALNFKMYGIAVSPLFQI